MAGIDAPSMDLTARIAATRKRLVMSGDIEPMKPGERMIHGRSPGAALDLGALSRADAARERRGARSTEVVEMDMTDYTGTQPGSKEIAAAADADEEFVIGEGDDDDEPADNGFDLGPDEPRYEPDDEPEPEEIALGPMFSGRDHSEEIALILEGQEEILNRLAGLEAGLLAFAQGIAGEFEKLQHPLVAVQAPEHDLEAELREAFTVPLVVPEAPVRVPWYRRVFTGSTGTVSNWP